MITQYTGSYSNPPADVQSVFANKISLLDKYMLMQTGENQYIGLVYNPATKACKAYTFTRQSDSGYYGRYVLQESSSEYAYTLSNECYVYSNEGLGKALDVPAYGGAIAWSLTILTCFAVLGVLFKGVLYRCLKRR